MNQKEQEHLAALLMGQEVYSVDCESVCGRGIKFDDEALNQILGGPVKTLLEDKKGIQEIEEMLTGVISTGFERDALETILINDAPTTGWLIGEALAEVFVTDKDDCEFPWPTRRDLKNPNANATGADLVGFQRMKGEESPFRFAFGEVKTSQQEAWPPSVVQTRTGLEKQIEGLRDCQRTKSGLFRYLGIHAVNASWKHMYTSAVKRYLRSNYSDAALFGVLVRDVQPNGLDLKKCVENLANSKPSQTQISFYALYLPLGVISRLREIVVNGAPS